ncbi:MAG: hypothetical protein ACKVHO_25090, partial [Verrucomicrobiia bacterium]
MTIANLREKIEQKYDLRLEDIESECITITIADSGPAEVETLSPEEMEAQGVATDWEAVAGKGAGCHKRSSQTKASNL